MLEVNHVYQNSAGKKVTLIAIANQDSLNIDEDPLAVYVENSGGVYTLPVSDFQQLMVKTLDIPFYAVVG